MGDLQKRTKTVDRAIGTTNGIQITLGFVLNVFITVISITVAFVSLRADTFSALQQIAKQEALIIEQQRAIISIQMNVQKVSDKVDTLFDSYERDANKYIREGRDKR